MFDKAIQFLKDHKEIALATSEGNLPKLRIFQIMKQEGHVLYFATSAQKAVYRELRQNPNVEILAYADNISVRCSGMVNFNVEDDVKRWIYDNNPVLPRLYTSYDQMEYFCLPIAEMDYYDLIPDLRHRRYSNISTSLQARSATVSSVRDTRIITDDSAKICTELSSRTENPGTSHPMNGVLRIIHFSYSYSPMIVTTNSLEPP